MEVVPVTSGTQQPSSWAKWIRKIYETDPLICTECGEPMRIIAFITDPREVVKILPRSTIERGKGICVLSGPFCRFSVPSKAMEIPSKKERHRKPNTVKSNPSILPQMPLEPWKYSLDSF